SREDSARSLWFGFGLDGNGFDTTEPAFARVAPHSSPRCGHGLRGNTVTIDPAPVQTIRTASDETKLVERLIGQIGRDRYTRFFDGSVRFESTPQAMVLQVGSEFESDLLQRRFASDVERAVE